MPSLNNSTDQMINSENMPISNRESRYMNVSLDQWKALISVVDSGGYEKAAEALHKSQSSVTYAVQKLQSQLGVKAFEVKGRKAVLTPTGEFLYRRARALVEEAEATERAAKKLSAGWEAEIGIAMDVAFPSWLLLQCLARFGDESPHTRIEVIESVLGGTAEALLLGQAQLAITGMRAAGIRRRAADADPLPRRARTRSIRCTSSAGR